MESRWQTTPVAILLRLLGDLLVVNLLMIICSFAVVTVGASVSAMFAVVYLRVRDDGEVPVIKTFFRFFVKNFGKALVLSLITAVVAGLAAGDFWFAVNSQPPIQNVYFIVGTVIALMDVIVVLLGFSQQSIYDNSIGNYIKNSFFLAFIAPGRLLLAVAAWVIPWLLMVMIPDFFLIRFGFVYLLWGFSLPAWITARLFYGVFQKAGGSPEQEASSTDAD